jgi:hypothetical protein
MGDGCVHAFPCLLRHACFQHDEEITCMQYNATYVYVYVFHLVELSRTPLNRIDETLARCLSYRIELGES